MKKLTYIILFFISACSYFNKKDNPTAVARVKDKFLLLSDLQDIVPKDVSLEDSALIVNAFIDKWVKEHLVLQRAKLNLNLNQKELNKQLEDYKMSLITYAYEKELIKQKLDTNVSDQEIKIFYENSPQNFELKNDIVKVRYLKVLKNTPQIKKIRKVYKSDKPKDIEILKEFAHQYGEKFYLNDKQWILFEDLKKEVPLKINQKRNFFKNFKFIEVKDSLSYYFVYIKDFKLEHDLSPLGFERENIKNIILNKRKLTLINKVKNELYQDALYKKEIEIYDLNQAKDK